MSDKDQTVHVRCSRCGDIYLAPFARSRCLTCGHQPGGLSPFAILTPLIWIFLGLSVLYIGLWFSGFWAAPPGAAPQVATLPTIHHGSVRQHKPTHHS